MWWVGPPRFQHQTDKNIFFFHLLCVRQFNSTSEETFSFRTPPFHWNHLRSSDKLALRNSTKFLTFFFTNSSVTLHPKENYWFLVGLRRFVISQATEPGEHTILRPQMKCQLISTTLHTTQYNYSLLRTP